jgi:UDP-2-acetamido-3-amino-2,3-dideoxy-glucuronate N-acetyltransferase
VLLVSEAEASGRYPGVYLHPTALVEADSIGPGTRVWVFCNLMAGSRIGAGCQICDRCFVEKGAVLGDGVTLKCGVSVWDGITLEEGVFVGPGVMFTNDPRPRSGRHLAEYPRTVVERFASLGAGCIILPGLRVGHHAMIAAGAVVTRDVPAFALVAGNPARRVGWVCVCGGRIREEAGAASACGDCGRRFRWAGSGPLLAAGSDDPRGGAGDGG